MRNPADISEIYEFADFRLDVAERVLASAETGERIQNGLLLALEKGNGTARWGAVPVRTREVRRRPA